MEMEYTKDFSVIIPVWRGAIKYLPKLFDSIPKKKGIEIIVVDNSKEPVNRDEILSDREITFLHSAPERHAGGSRNDGMAAAQGKWLLFADADDYYAPGAFEVFYSKYNSDAEMVFTKPTGIYEDTDEHSDRGDGYANLVHGYCVGKVSEEKLRLGFTTPWCKMVSHALVDREGLRYDEIRAGNDTFFSLASGYFAKTIEAVDEVTYIVTVNYGSLTHRRDKEVIKARLYSRLHRNQFLRDHGRGNHQLSVMGYFHDSFRYGLGTVWACVRMILKFRQNPFVGYKHWHKNIKVKEQNENSDRKYVAEK